MIRWLASAPQALVWMLGGQALLAVIVLLVPFGFDHPSALGLDFGHFLLVLALYLLVLVAGLIAALQRKQWLWLGLQIAAPCVIFGLAVAGVLAL